MEVPEEPLFQGQEVLISVLCLDKAFGVER